MKLRHGIAVYHENDSKESVSELGPRSGHVKMRSRQQNPSSMRVGMIYIHQDSDYFCRSTGPSFLSTWMICSGH